MTATVPTQEQVDQIAQELAPDVVRIRCREDLDWYGDPALRFRVILSDEASQRPRLAEVARKVRTAVSDRLRLSESDRIPFFRFRSQSEQEKIREASWE
jgi:hypothetical protein